MNLLPTAALFAIPAGTSELSDLTMEILRVFVHFVHVRVRKRDGKENGLVGPY